MGDISDDEDPQNREQVRRRDLGKKVCADCLGVGSEFYFAKVGVSGAADPGQALRRECATCRGRGYMALIYQPDGGHPTVCSMPDLVEGARRRYDQGKLSRKSLDVVLAFATRPRAPGT